MSHAACHLCEGANWIEENIGEEVEIEIGPSLTCGHIFARFTMLPAMIQASETTKRHLEDSQ